MTQLAKKYEAEADTWRTFEQGLSENNMARTLRDVDSVQYQSRRAKVEDKPKRGRPPKTKHPFPLALYKAGSDPSRWALAHGYSRDTVKSWYADPAGTGGRPIPLEAAKIIEKEFKLPPTEQTWRHGIK